MSGRSEKIGLHAAAGILIALLIITSVAVSSLKVPALRFPWSAPPSPHTGTLAVMLTDAPANLTHLNVTLDSISAHRKGDGNETWINLAFTNDREEVYFDLLALQNVVLNLSVTEIPPGEYTMIRMHLKTANATYVAGNTTDLNVPSEHINLIIHFEVVKGEETTVLIDMQTNWTAISQNKTFRPVLKATVLP